MLSYRIQFLVSLSVLISFSFDPNHFSAVLTEQFCYIRYQAKKNIELAF
jgi:hypothetical protein